MTPTRVRGAEKLRAAPSLSMASAGGGATWDIVGVRPNRRTFQRIRRTTEEPETTNWNEGRPLTKAEKSEVRVCARRRRALRMAACVGAGILVGLGSAAEAQEVQWVAASPVLMARAEAVGAGALPDAPDAAVTSSSVLPAVRESGQPGGMGGRGGQPMASTSDKYIAPGQPVPSLTVGNKFALGIKDAISPLSAIGWVVTAGYEQGTNESPNYGQTGKGFAQRLGAAAARASSEGVFSDSVLASVLREDPRYYRMGPGNNFFKRTIYAGTRTLITRTDGGRVTPNFALLGGNLAGSYLTKAYYPPLNTSNTEVLKTFGGSVGGSALGFFVSEFLSGALNVFHSAKPAAN